MTNENWTVRKSNVMNIYTLHVARKGFAGGHFVVFRANHASRQIDVLRILHDSMDLQRHLH